MDERFPTEEKSGDVRIVRRQTVSREAVEQSREDFESKFRPVISATEKWRKESCSSVTKVC
mgnify:CR=1 FL=1